MALGDRRPRPGSGLPPRLRPGAGSAAPPGSRQPAILAAIGAAPFVAVLATAGVPDWSLLLLAPPLFVVAGVAFLTAGAGGRRRQPRLVLVGVLYLALAVASAVLIYRLISGYNYFVSGSL
jgi:hypothetical protein